MSVAVVTDSTAYLPAELVDAYGLTVVPLTVVLNGAEGLEGVEFFPADAARALREKRARVSTSRPAPEVFARTYRRLLADGAQAVVSVHLSADLSGTYDAAVLAAAEVGDERVTVVDTRLIGMGVGFPAMAAAAVAADGGGPRAGPAGRARRRRPHRRSTSMWTPWSSCAAGAGSTPRPRWWARRCR